MKHCPLNIEIHVVDLRHRKNNNSIDYKKNNNINGEQITRIKREEEKS